MLPRKNSCHEAVPRLEDADLASPSLTLLLTKHALSKLSEKSSRMLFWWRIRVTVRRAGFSSTFIVHHQRGWGALGYSFPKRTAFRPSPRPKDKSKEEWVR
jgi:hypothetical protein